MSKAYRFILEGTQQVPGVVSAASGLGTAIFDSNISALSYYMNVTGLDWGAFLGQPAETPSALDNVTGAHFHSGARGANGGVIMPWLSDVDDFTASAPSGGTRTLSGIWEQTDLPALTAAFAALLDSGLLGADIGVYANIHTAGFPGGELRGQFVTIATDAGETVNGTAGDDLLPGLGGDDTIIGGLGNDTLYGGGGGDTQYGSEGIDTIDTGASLDTSPFDYVYGGDASDTIRTTGARQIVVIYGDGLNYGGVQGLLPGNDVIDLSGADTDTNLANYTFSYVYSGGGGDTITGSWRHDYLYGGDGGDAITGGNGDDVVDGGAGNDDLNGGLGRDNIYGGAGDDTLHSGGSNPFGLLERLYGGDGSDTIYATAPGYYNIWGDDLNNATVMGTLPGDDIIDLSAAGTNDGKYINVWAGGGWDNITGSDGLDYIYGENEPDSILGNGGDDFIYGGTGNDYLEGGSGRDYVEASYDDDRVFGGLGDDIVYAQAGDDTVYGGDGSDYLYGGDGTDYLYGGAGVDVLFGDGRDFGFFGGDGRDYLVWQDVTTPANVNLTFSLLEVAYGYNGADVFYASGATMQIELHGGGGNDVLIGGGSGGSILLGEADNDRLVSEIGIDHMVGGSGIDTFVFSSNGATDYIYDFVSGTDKIDFKALAGAGIHSLANLLVDPNYAALGWYGYGYGTGTVWVNTTAAGGTQPVAADFLFT